MILCHYEATRRKSIIVILGKKVENLSVGKRAGRRIVYVSRTGCGQARKNDERRRK